MLRLNSEITIGNLRFTFVTNLQINKSWETLTDTAVISLPNNIRKKNEEIKDLIKVNDAVTIKLGYFPNLVTRFTGFVSKVVPESPLKVMCEDESFKLKQEYLESYSKKPVSLETLITDNYTGETKIADADLGGFSISKGSTLTQVLQEVRTTYKLYAWFRNGVLNAGLPFDGTGTTQEFKFQRNVIDGKNLRFTNDTDLRTVAYGVSVLSDGSKLELYTYYENGNIKTSETNPGGNLNTMKIPGLSKAKLTKLLERWLPNLHYTGFQGSFVTFGEPVVDHGDIAKLSDLKFPERDGSYLIKAVQIDFGVGGYRQTIELDRAV
jgi:hypothetical protein